MIEKLDQLTMGQFINMLCGDTSVLKGRHEMVPESKMAIAVRNIIFEYKEIADQSGVRGYLNTIEELLNARIESVLFSMCNNLIGYGEHDRAREVMKVYGIDADSMSDLRVAAEIKSRYERAKSTVARIEEDGQDSKEESDIRRSFDEQTAALMAYFKFQIDTSTMKATVYAHLIARYNREIKVQLAAMKNIQGK